MDTVTELPATMTEWRQSRYGGPETVAAVTASLPEPGEGEVLLRVRATALNSGDVKVMRGEPLLVRTAFGLRRPRRTVRGMDVAGTVVSLGAGVEQFALGDEVVGELPGGGLAAYAVAPVTRLVRRPSVVEPRDAASLPIAAGTALLALKGVEAGGRVLVLGASGGVGTFAVQLGADRGASVWATCGAANEQRVRELGAERTLDYRRTSAKDLPADSFDRIVDIAGDSPLRDLQRLLRPGGSIVLVSGSGNRVTGPMARMLRAAVLSIGSRRRIRPLLAVPDTTALAQLLDLVVAGRVKPLIERVYTQGEARAALAHVDGGHTVGKVVVVP